MTIQAELNEKVPVLIPTPRQIRIRYRKFLVAMFAWPLFVWAMWGTYRLPGGHLYVDRSNFSERHLVAALATIFFTIAVIVYFSKSKRTRANQKRILVEGLPVWGYVQQNEDLYLTYEVGSRTFEKILPRTTNFLIAMTGLKNPTVVFVDSRDPERYVLYETSWYRIRGLKIVS